MDLKDHPQIKTTKEMTDIKNRANQMHIILTKEAQRILIVSLMPNISVMKEIRSKFSLRIALKFRMVDQGRQVAS